MHRRGGDALAAVTTERVVDHQANHFGRDESFDDQGRQLQADGVCGPAGSGEEPMVAAEVLVTHRLRRPHHLGHRVAAQVEHPARHQGHEAVERRRGEADRESLQQGQEGRYDEGIRHRSLRDCGCVATSSSQMSIVMDTPFVHASLAEALRGGATCASRSRTAIAPPAAREARRWGGAAARAGGAAAEHGAGWAAPLKSAQHETSTRSRKFLPGSGTNKQGKSERKSKPFPGFCRPFACE